ncbi:MAG: ribosomal subunit interface protein [Elusimicrobia bacterium CG1_02_63_36]|nr:MAG: ribosomal subunit interface protein [Elusimicrobia bacterium CG1_02_63_36]PIP84816.1 MAG: ribosomal subunit interface protein [Elusimicrobia bacterium CG22_combo_CG10-13_8_21_14_all_63_91]PJA16164.1 MAG: ribosomal subunit interface protein [Elusimicrobia bacterium CG_4_10_14_0_2_um_filter_63_34]PJB26338.1 MAG: ribosomal subunit interface protein [Elusimicrobia bacterium CG_4_9_14_3_um_filter_62_55]
MKIHVTGRHMRLTKPIQNYVDEKVSKAQRYFDNIVWAQVLLSVEKRSHQCEIILHASKQTFRSLATSSTLYAAIDMASDKIDTQLRRYKDRVKGRNKKGRASATQALSEEMDPTPVRFSVVKQVPLIPMTADEAAQQMEDLGYTFWMFQDSETKQVNVIFRRLDESFGLLQPTKNVKAAKKAIR